MSLTFAVVIVRSVVSRRFGLRTKMAMRSESLEVRANVPGGRYRLVRDFIFEIASQFGNMNGSFGKLSKTASLSTQSVSSGKGVGESQVGLSFSDHSERTQLITSTSGLLRQSPIEPNHKYNDAFLVRATEEQIRTNRERSDDQRISIVLSGKDHLS